MHLRTRVVSLLLMYCVSAVYAQGAKPETAPRLTPSGYKHWQLLAEPPYPSDNKPSAARVELGKMLFFDPRLSRDANMSCASCHNPMFGWSDGLDTGRGFQGKLLDRASPTIVNTAYNTIHMWDGRKKNLEDQTMGPLEAEAEMNTDFDHFFTWMNSNPEYRSAFARAYPSEAIGPATLRKAIAAFERTIVSRDSPFDHWLAGDQKAMTQQQLRGFIIFSEKNKGNCSACHAAPNFTDNGFHNTGLASFGKDNPDPGRFKLKPVKSMKGAFKTPTLRDIEYTAPYFHDGSAKTLMDVVEHYDTGGKVRTNLSPNMQPLHLTQIEKEDLISFLKALSSPLSTVALPTLPRN